MSVKSNRGLSSLYSLRMLMGVAMVTAIIITVAITNLLSRDDASRQIEELFDAQMLQTAKVLELFYVSEFTDVKIKQLIQQPIKLHVQQTDIETFAEQSTTANLMYENKMSFQLLSESGELLVYSDSSGEKSLSRLVQGYELRNIDNALWHVFSYFSKTHRIWIVTAQSEDVREELLAKMMSNTWTVPFLVMPVVLLVFLLITYYLFKPVKTLEANLLTRAPQDLSPINIALPTELIPVQRALNDYIHRISQAMQRERRFSADAAHELKTPLAIVKLHHNGLRDLYGDTVEQLVTEPQQAQLHLSAIEQGVDRMSHMVEQLLLLSRVDAIEALNLQQCRVSDIIEASINQLITIIADYEWQIDICPSIIATVDEFYMELVCKNLIENACKYSPKESIISIQAIEQDNKIILKFADSGKGMSETQIARAKERFYRVDENDSQGAGLGLSICQHIISLHGGELNLAANQPKGLVVSMSWPNATQ
ncbi:ATP-binding protein [Shewanella sp. HL-SH5]|uniref:ATP-binding protein n=1 Tax=Shewanella sp. HL-SH5 TaxID=3436241 RepID=UPI003EB9B1BF